MGRDGLTGKPELPPYVMPDKQRDGRPRWLFRRRGHRKVTLKGEPGSKEFWASYAAAMTGQSDPEAAKAQLGKRLPNTKGTLEWLCQQYYASGEFRQNAKMTQDGRRYVLNQVLAEPLKQGKPELMKDCPIASLTRIHVTKLRDRKVDQPSAANNRLNYLRQMFAWAVEEKLMEENPAIGVKHLNVAKGGHHSWSEEEVHRYEETHPIGTKARLALSLILFTGFRISDLAQLGRQHVSKTIDPEIGVYWIEKREHKNRSRQEKMLRVPLLPILQQIIEASPTGDLTFLVNERNRPFAIVRLGTRIREWCKEAGLPHCSAHGLRKAGAAVAAENGATTEQLKAIFGWLNSAEADVYTRKAQQKRMAAQAMHLLIPKTKA